MVAPHAGAWIETLSVLGASFLCLVAPHAGAWIETRFSRKLLTLFAVAPHAGAWIETSQSWTPYMPIKGRAPRGRVD